MDFLDADMIENNGRLFLLLTLFLILCSCNVQEEKIIEQLPANFSLENLLFLPGADNVELTSLDGNEIKLHGYLGFPPEAVIEMDDQGWVAGALDSGKKFSPINTILVAKIDKKLNIVYRDTIDLSDHHIMTHDVNDEVLFLGGHNGNNPPKAKAYMVDLNSDNFELEPIEIPPDISWCHGIDDFMFYNDQIVLVDNVVVPKYMILYDKELTFIGTHELMIKGVWQEIIKAIPGYRKILIHSTSSSGYVGSADVFSVLNKNSLVQETDTYLSFREFIFDKYIKSEYVDSYEQWVQKRWGEEIRSEIIQKLSAANELHKNSNRVFDCTLYKDRVFYLQCDNRLFEWEYNIADTIHVELKTDTPIDKDMNSIVMMNDDVIILRNDTDYQLLTYTK